MAERARPIYKESSQWPGWISIVFWGAILVSLAGIMISDDIGDRERLLGGVLTGGIGVLVQFLVAGLTVRLYRDKMTVGIGSSGWFKRSVAYADVASIESVKYSPIREFGGWGIRKGRGGKTAWTARGDQAVVLHLRDGAHLYVGSDNPHRLEERIRTIAGSRIG